MLQLNVKSLCVVLLMALAVLLTGCSTTLQSSGAQCPALPTMPSVSEPIPSERYSERAQRNIETWRNELTGTQATSRP